ALPLITSNDQAVLYGDYFSSLPFYIRANRPLWVVLSGRGAAIMGSFYIAEKNPPAARGAGDVIMSFDEFAELWDHSPQRLLVFVEEKKLQRLAKDVGTPPKRLLTAGDVVLVSNR